jgi:hypothetical protein
MLSVIVKRSEEPTVIQMTQADLVKQLNEINGAEILLEDSWTEGLKKVRTPYVCLVEADCVLSAHYFSSNFNLLKKNHSQAIGGKGSGRGMGGGGYSKLSILSSAIGIKKFDNRIFNYRLAKVNDINVNNVTGKSWHIQPEREKLDIYLYAVQIGFVPGAVMRMTAISDMIDKVNWDQPNLVKLSTEVCFHLWNTNRRITLNPSTTYVSNLDSLEEPPLFDINVPMTVATIFRREYL